MVFEGALGFTLEKQTDNKLTIQIEILEACIKESTAILLKMKQILKKDTEGQLPVQKLVSPANYFSFFFFVFAETYF
jgi:hypothetical protein